jgi:type IV secretion system protein VirB11
MTLPNKPSEEMLSLLGEFELDPLEKRYLGPLLKYMTAERLADVKEVVMNKPGEVAYEMVDGSWKFEEAPELTLEQLTDAARMIANRFGQIFSPSHPIMSCKMPQGHRVQIVAGHHTGSGFSMAIRIQRKKIFTLDDYGLDKETQDKLIDAIRRKKTLLISGGTATGKTSFMNVALRYIPEEERLITLEDVPELDVPQRNCTQLIFSNESGGFEAGSVSDLLNATLRMRPDRILLGEIRKENAFAFCSAINTGHEGSMATIHANNPKMAVNAVMNRVLMNGDAPESALAVLKNQLLDDIQAVVQLTRVGPKVQATFTTLKDALGDN